MVIRCYVGRLRDNLKIPQQLDLFGTSIEDYFRRSSTVGRTNPAIELEIDTTRQDHSLLSANLPTTVVSLHEKLECLTSANHRETTNTHPSIGVIFADYHEINVRGLDNRPIFGAMFDIGFAPTVREHPSIINPDRFRGQPRNGCAVFLSAIADNREGDARRREEVYTTIHELGHVFNLWHLPRHKSFMSSADSYGSDGPSHDHCKFLNSADPAHQTAFLSLCGESDYVTPGGTAYGTRGMLGPSGDSAYSRERAKTDDPIQLRIRASKAEFWNFEPIELDVTVATTNRRHAIIPDMVDPAYSDFSIFVEQPDGTRFRYRPTRNLCPHPGKRKITPNLPMERDITLFGQAGGYTFRMPGVHTIQAEFRISASRTVASNVEEVLVRTEMRDSEEFQLLQPILTSPVCARHLFYRDVPRDANDRRYIKEAFDVLRGTYAGDYLRYASAHAFAIRSHVARRRVRSKLTTWATETLKACAQSKHLGELRRRKSVEINEIVQSGTHPIERPRK